MGDQLVMEAAHGLLAGAVPWGVPPQRGERELLVAQRKVPWLHRVTSLIAHDFATVPWELFVARNAAGKPTKALHLTAGDHAYRRSLRRKSATSDQRDRLDVQQIMRHPLLDLMRGPNPVMSAMAFWEVFELYLLLPGEFFAVIERNEFGMPIQLWPVPGYWVRQTPYHGSPFFHFNFGTWFVNIPERDVIWIRHLRAENPFWRGSGLGEALGDEIEIDAYAAKTVKNHFWNQGVPAAIASLEGAPDTQMDRVRESFYQAIQGYWNAGKTFFTNKKIDYKQMSPTFADQKLVELRKASRDVIVQAFGIPPEMMGILENSNRSTITVAASIYAERVLKPELEFARSELQHRLVPEFDPALLIDYVSPSPDDQAFDLDVAKAAPWAFSKNEWRALGGKDPLEGGDDEFLPMPTASAAPKDGGAGPALPPGKGGDPEWVKSLPAPVRREEGDEGDEDDSVSLSDGDIERIAQAALDDAVSAPMQALLGDELRGWIKQAATTLGVDLNFQLINPKIAEFARARAGDKIKGLGSVNDTTRQAIRDTLGEGIDAGESIRDLRKRIEEVFEDARGYRATAIARTETTHAAGWGNTAAMRESGVVQKREWVSTRDSRTRDSHAEMDGQEVGINEPFRTPDGEAGDFPGDFSDPAESVNCRCTVVAVIDDKSSKQDRDVLWKAFDEAVTPWEEKTIRVLRKAFSVQRVAVLKALREATR